MLAILTSNKLFIAIVKKSVKYKTVTSLY